MTKHGSPLFFPDRLDYRCYLSLPFPPHTIKERKLVCIIQHIKLKLWTIIKGGLYITFDSKSIHRSLHIPLREM